jgi:hypothetical protein
LDGPVWSSLTWSVLDWVFFKVVEWQVQVEGHLAKVTRNRERGVRLAKEDTSVVMRLFHNGTTSALLGRATALTFTSRNCTKHNCRCDYMDQPPATEESARSPRTPDLQMTPEIERELDLWRMTGEPPFPELQMTSKSYWHRFSGIDLRLIHHIAGLSIDMHQRGYSGCTVWAQKMPACVTAENCTS